MISELDPVFKNQIFEIEHTCCANINNSAIVITNTKLSDQEKEFKQEICNNAFYSLGVIENYPDRLCNKNETEGYLDIFKDSCSSIFDAKVYSFQCYKNPHFLLYDNYEEYFAIKKSLDKYSSHLKLLGKVSEYEKLYTNPIRNLGCLFWEFSSRNATMFFTKFPGSYTNNQVEENHVRTITSQSPIKLKEIIINPQSKDALNLTASFFYKIVIYLLILCTGLLGIVIFLLVTCIVQTRRPKS